MDPQVIKAALEDALGEAYEVKDEVAEYAEARGRHLAGILASGEAGFAEALIVERDNVALAAGIAVAGAADSIALRALGVIQGVLAMLARVMV
jgi:hypothetical protein